MSLIATPGAADANSYLTVAEFDAYLDSRIGGATVKALAVAVKETLLMMATRTLDSMTGSVRIFVSDCESPHYETMPSWTGAAVTSTQALAWPRSGMYNRNGFAIATDVIPQELKNATAELAFQLYTTDSTLDNSAAVGGVSAIKAGSVAIEFAESILTSKVIPDMVKYLLVASWLTDVVYDYVLSAQFDVL